ncbi:hypothetical protein PAEPH01_0524 [Pancytospora epiphaga]|nr:hypothetical protein PAEPH01_0524 [Pancytospora epiphaga]
MTQYEEKHCGICLEFLDIPHSLPCNHSFCFICIARHLSFRKFCPMCFSGTYGLNSLVTSHSRNNIPKLPDQIFKRTLSNYSRILKRYFVRTDGTLEQLESRFSELILQIMLEQFREHPVDFGEIAWRVHSNERRLIKTEYRKEEKIMKTLEELRAKIEILRKKNI